MKNKNNSSESKIIIGESTVWKYIEYSNVEIWYAGDIQAIRSIIKSLLSVGICAKSLTSVLVKKNESFSVIAKSGKITFAFTDYCRSYPIFYSVQENEIMISNDANKLKDNIKNTSVIGESVFDCLALGYVTGNKTLYSNLKQLSVCEYLLLNHDLSSPVFGKYYLYHDKRNKTQGSEDYFASRLGEVIDCSVQRLIKNANNAPIVVPISGGLDSRLVLAKLVEHGYKNVSSFSYGPNSNADARIGKDVSGQLGVPWEFVSISSKETKSFYQSDIRKEYSSFADGLNTIPNYQDLLPIYKLKKTGRLSTDSLIVNGQSGDFNSGGHIPDSLMKREATLSDLLSELIKKHYSLWGKMLTENNTKIINENIIQLLKNSDKNSIHDSLTYNELANLYERWEFEERQIKYIINGQRVYDYFSLNWHLPLWDGEFVRFWCGVPVELRYKQKLYRKYLTSWNYKELFKEFNPPISAWSKKASCAIVPLSLLLRITLGRERRDYFIKYFDYISRYGNHYHSFGFKTFAENIHEIKNPFSIYTMSWLCERGLSSHIDGFGLDPLFDK